MPCQGEEQGLYFPLVPEALIRRPGDDPMAQSINVDRRRILGAGLAFVAAAASPKARAQAASFGPLKQIDAGVLNVGYAETGPANGTPVLLLHGWPYDVHTYVDVAPLLASAGHRVIRATLRGSFGRPPRRSGISMTLRSIGRRLPSTIRITSPFRFTTIGGASGSPTARRSRTRSRLGSPSSQTFPCPRSRLKATRTALHIRTPARTQKGSQVSTRTTISLAASGTTCPKKRPALLPRRSWTP